MSKRVALEVTRTVRLTELQLGILEAVAARAEAAARRKELCVVGVRELMGEFGCGRSAVINAIGSCIEQDWLTSIAVYRIDGGRAESAYALTESGRAICAAAAEVAGMASEGGADRVRI